MYKIFVFTLLLTINVSFINARCDPYTDDGVSKIKCVYATLEEVNAITDSRKYTEMQIQNGLIIDLPSRAINHIKLSKLESVNGEIRTLQSTTFANLRSLQHLDLSSNQIRTLPAKAFQRNTELTYLKLENNSISKIYRNTFISLPNLKHLNLNWNQLTTIKTIFSSLTQLETLLLSDNKISSIDKATFIENINLKLLTINSNRLTDLKQGTFESDVKGIFYAYETFVYTPQSSILELEIQDNNFKLIKNIYFEHLKRVVKLSLSNCGIQMFESNFVFNITTKITNLSLSYNEIEIFPEEIFKNLVSLNILLLNNNKLTTLQSGLLKRNTRLEELNLANNQITVLNAEVFKKLKNLHTLNLDGNLIENVPKDVFEHLRSLKTLDLNRNNLKYIESGSFDSLIRLKYLSIDRNDLTEIGNNVLFRLAELNKLVLLGNKINNIQPGTFTTFHEGNEDVSSPILDLVLNKNNLSIVLTYDMFSPLNRLITLEASLCNIKGLNDDVFKSMGDSLQILDLSGNQIQELEIGIFDTLKNLITLKLANNLLTTFDNDLFLELSSLESLDCSGNLFRTIPTGLFNIVQLRSVKFSSNDIIHLSPDTFDGEDCLVERFDVYDNKLTYLDKSFLQNSHLKFFNFGKNPWQCGCLSELMNEVRELNIEILTDNYFDGTNPCCVVTSNNNTCIHESSLAVDLYRKYNTIKHRIN